MSISNSVSSPLPLSRPTPLPSREPETREAPWPGRTTTWLAGVGVAELTQIATLLLLVIYLDGPSKLNTPLLSLGVAGLLFRPLRERAIYWLLGAGLLCLRHLFVWHTLDNHQWLLTYWFLALGLSRLSSDSQRSLSASARGLLGGCFLLAVAWKALTAEFRDGTFFEVTLLSDARFAVLANTLGGVERSRVEGFTRMLLELAHFSGSVELIPFAPGARVQVIGRLLTAWTLAIEAALALTFLWPARSRWEPRLVRHRHWLLLLFVASSYPVAPVIGFGWILIVLGLACAPERSPRLVTAYLLTLTALPLGGVALKRLLG